MNEIGLDSTMVMLILPIIIIQVVLAIIALIDCIRIEKTNGPKWMWICLILFISFIGPILYFTVGRRNH